MPITKRRAEHVTVLDLAPENILACEQRLQDLNPACRVDTKVGSVLRLPFEPARFDVAWLANTSQYLTDDELARALSEIVRVTKRGGIITIKQADATGIQFGVHFGVAFFGALGTAKGLTDFSAKGDAVNTAARLASKAAAGEIIVSEQALKKAGIDDSRLESRELVLKGITEPVSVRVLHGA